MPITPNILEHSVGRNNDDGTVYTWKDYGVKFFETILKRHPSVSAYVGSVKNTLLPVWVVKQKNVLPAK